jgi:outer membrane cobalamin receptor
MGKNIYELSFVNYGKMYTTDDSDTSRYLINSYSLINFKYNYKLSPEMKISFNVNNLFNNKSKKMEGYTINGRKLMLNFEMQY